MGEIRQDDESCSNCLGTVTCDEVGKPVSEPFCDGEIIAPYWCKDYQRCEIHYLKTHPEPFLQVCQEHKKFEVRNNDRGFKKGDILCLEEWSPVKLEYTGAFIVVKVTYITQGTWGLPENMCTMSIVLFPKDDGIKRLDIKEFREGGYLQELNRQFLHPLGLAMEVSIDDKGVETLGGIWDYRNDPEGMLYGKCPDKEAFKLRIVRFKKIQSECKASRLSRGKSVGYYIQPISSMKPKKSTK